MPVTVSEAIRKGQTTINLPSGLIFFGFVVIGVVFSVQYQNFAGWIIAGSLILGLLLCLLYWCAKITTWKIWAYENVDHIHELQQKAVDSKLIYPDGSFWDKLAIASAEDKQRLAAAQGRFKQNDVFTDDVMVPTESLIYFSKQTSMFNMLMNIEVSRLPKWDYSRRSMSEIMRGVITYFVVLKKACRFFTKIAI